MPSTASGGDMTKLLLAAALFLVASPARSGANPVEIRFSESQQRQWLGTAHDILCSDVMCIECDVDGASARYVLRSTGEEKLGWMAIGFGRNMDDSPMVIVWPSLSANGAFETVTLSQRKAPYEIMPTPDPKPPFDAKISFHDTSVTEERSRIAFTRLAPQDGMQNIIWAFSRTPPRSTDADADIAIHHRIGRGTLNLTRTMPVPAAVEPVLPALPPTPPAESSGQEEESEEEARGAREGEPHGGSERGFASLLHGALCMAGFLLVIPSGELVVRYAKVTDSPRAFQLHRLLQFGIAGGFIAGGTLAYLFIEDDGLGVAVAHKVGSVNLLLLYIVQCAYGSWVYRIPGRSRTRVHGLLLAGLGASIVLLAFYQAWLGLVSAGRDTLVRVWLVLLISVPSLYIFGAVVVKWRFESVQVVERSLYVATLDTGAPHDELADGGEKL